MKHGRSSRRSPGRLDIEYDLIPTHNSVSFTLTMVSTRSRDKQSKVGDKREAEEVDRSDAKKSKVHNGGTGKDGKLEVGDDGQIGLKEEKEDDVQDKEEDKVEDGGTTGNTPKEEGSSDEQKPNDQAEDAKAHDDSDARTRSGPGETKQEVRRVLYLI